MNPETQFSPDTQFSKARIEMLCDGVFAIAMTLLVLELKVPDVPKGAPTAEVWRALSAHGLSFFAFALTFLLAGQSWIIHHIFFHYLKHATQSVAVLTLFYLMFVSLLPFSTSMFVAYGPSQRVGMIIYLGNQFILASLIAAQFLVARRQGLLTGAATDPRRRRFSFTIGALPVVFALMLIVQAINPAWFVGFAWALIVSGLAARLVRRQLAKRAGPALPS